MSQFIRNYAVHDFRKTSYWFCFPVDPPDSPPEDRKMFNLTYGFSSINDDYTFNLTVAWEPPRYPYKNISEYDFFWTKDRVDVGLPWNAVRTQVTLLKCYVWYAFFSQTLMYIAVKMVERNPNDVQGISKLEEESSGVAVYFRWFISFPICTC